MRRCLRTTLALLAVVLAGCSGGDSGHDVTVGYVTNGVADFWTIAEKGAVDGGREFGVDVEVRMPPDGVGDQQRMVEELLALGVDGIAISPIDPDRQVDLLQEIADRTLYVTQDSDAPESPRVAYVGMDNYDAGRMAGQLVKDAMPGGGSVMIFVGRLGQANAKLRRQGVIDELVGRTPDASRYDEPGSGPIEGAADNGSTYTVLDTRTDNFDFGKAKAQAEDALTKDPDLGAMVGLFEYNPPLMLDAVREAGRLGEVRIVGFDENRRTLQAIADGEIHGTVVQNPYEYGRKSVEVLAKLARGEDAGIPADKTIAIPARKIVKGNVEAFRKDLAAKVGDGSDPKADAGKSEAGKADDAP